MASKSTFLRDGSIAEQQLAPHLRRRKVGVASIINTAGGSTSSSGAIVGLYSGGVQSISVDAYDSTDTLVIASTTHISYTDVTSVSPLTLELTQAIDIEIDLDVSGEYTHLIVTCNDKDLAKHAVRTGTHIYMYARLLPAGQPITIALRSLGFGGSAQINSSTIALRAV